MTLLPDLFLVDIYNLSDSDRATLDLAETVSAENDEYAVLCSGEIDDIYTHPEDANTITTVVLVDGKSLWERKISRTLGPGSGVKDALTTILGPGVMGYFAADDVRMIRGQTFSGKLPEAVATLAKTVNARAFVTHGAVFVAKKGEAENCITIDDDDVIDTPSMAGGTMILKTRVKGYSVGILLEYGGKAYRLASQTINADNQKGTWATELTLVDEEHLSAYGLEGGL